MCGCGHPLLHGDEMHHGDSQQWRGSAEPVAAHVTTAPCPGCGAAVQEDFVFCPRCSRELLIACPQCQRAVRRDWTHCAFCGADLVAEASGPAPASR